MSRRKNKGYRGRRTSKTWHEEEAKQEKKRVRTFNRSYKVAPVLNCTVQRTHSVGKEWTDQLRMVSYLLMCCAIFAVN